MTWLLLLACAAQIQRVGLVEVDGSRVVLVEPDGRELRLLAGDDATTFSHFDGLGVRVSGQRIGRRVVVRDWTITDGGDGSAPYVGRLRRYGSHWMIDDRATGSQLILVEETVGELARHEGQLVMVAGFVVGAHQVRVVAWRALED